MLTGGFCFNSSFYLSVFRVKLTVVWVSLAPPGYGRWE